jgi:hypothetical protein
VKVLGIPDAPFCRREEIIRPPCRLTLLYQPHTIPLP